MTDHQSGSDSRGHESRTTGNTGNILDQIIQEGRLGGTPQRREQGRLWLRDLISQATHQEDYTNRDIALLLQTRIQALDDIISDQLNEVLHDPQFQSLESVWRGLSCLVEQITGDQNVVIQIYPASLRELVREGLSSELHDLVVTERLGTLGADPFSALVGIYEFGKDSLGHLAQLGRLAAHARTVFLAAASPSLLGRDSFAEVSGRHRITDELELDDGWHYLVHDSAAEHLLLAMPRVLMREPYATDRSTPRYSHDEKFDGRDSSKYLWGSPLWHIAAQLAHAFSIGSWCADIAASPRTSISHGFASPWVPCEEGDLQMRGPLEVNLDDSALFQLRLAGLTSLSCDVHSDRIVIEQPQVLYRSRETTGQGRTTYHLLRDSIGRGRIEQYIISMAREMRGRIADSDQFRRNINRWVAANFAGNPDALRVEPVGDERFLVEGTITASTPGVAFRISVSVRLYTTQESSQPDSSIANESSQPNFGPTNFLVDIRHYFELLQEVAELKQRGLIGDIDQESIKRSVLQNVHRCLGDAPSARIGEVPSPAPLLPASSLEKRVSHVRISFDSAEATTAADYSVLFDVIEHVHALLCRPSFEILRVYRSSPGEIIGITFAQAAQALTEIFSFGNQIKDLRLSSVKVKEARLDLARKESELDEFKRHLEVKRGVSHLDEQIEAARKSVELEELRKKREEAIRERRKLLMEDVAQRFDLISKALPVLQSLPPDMRDRFKQELSSQMAHLGDTALVITEVRQLEPETGASA